MTWVYGVLCVVGFVVWAVLSENPKLRPYERLIAYITMGIPSALLIWSIYGK